MLYRQPPGNIYNADKTVFMYSLLKSTCPGYSTLSVKTKDPPHHYYVTGYLDVLSEEINAFLVEPTMETILLAVKIPKNKNLIDFRGIMSTL